MIEQGYLDKLIRFCDYRERAIKEVEKKAHQIDIPPQYISEYISELIHLDLLNESRFAQSFVQGKYRLKGWGRNKISAHLRHKGLSSELIQESLNEIDTSTYESRILELMERKWRDIKGSSEYEKKAKLYRFLAQRGFAMDEINKTWSSWQNKKAAP